jgi:L-asparaginase
VRSTKPVVVTGSMRPWTVIGSDGPANLFNAIRLAASERTACFGAVVMVNDEIHAAREVTKTNTYRTDTFASRRIGALGWIDGPNVRISRAPERRDRCTSPGRWRTPFDLRRVAADALPQVEIAYAYQEASGVPIDALAAAGVEGVVTAGTGAGGISGPMAAARTRALERGVRFMSTSRTGSGSVYVGATAPPGLLAGEDLLPQKARLFLLLALSRTDEPAALRDLFERYGSARYESTRPG